MQPPRGESPHGCCSWWQRRPPRRSRGWMHVSHRRRRLRPPRRQPPHPASRKREILGQLPGGGCLEPSLRPPYALIEVRGSQGASETRGGAPECWGGRPVQLHRPPPPHPPGCAPLPHRLRAAESQSGSRTSCSPPVAPSSCQRCSTGSTCAGSACGRSASRAHGAAGARKTTNLHPGRCRRCAAGPELLAGAPWCSDHLALAQPHEKNVLDPDARRGGDSAKAARVCRWSSTTD